MELLLLLSFGALILSATGQTTMTPNYLCPAGDSAVTFAYSSSPFSAWQSSANCSLSFCNVNVNSSNNCQAPIAHCFDYRTINNISYCAPGSLCSVLVPCDNITGTCASNTSVCIINSCCTPKAMCLPLVWTNFCSLGTSTLYSTSTTSITSNVGGTQTSSVSITASIVTTANSSSAAMSTTTTTVRTSTTMVTSTTVAGTQYRWNSTGITVAGTTGVAGASPSLLTYPCGIVLDSSNTLYIADSGSNRVQRWLLSASSGTTVAGQANGATGTTSNYLSTPNDVAVDSNGTVYVVDTYNHRVLSWTSGASSGTLVAGTGSPGSANNQLYNPRGIARDSSLGTLYIADYYNHRVMGYSSGASSGTVTAGGNGQGSATNQLNFPIGLYFDSSSNSLLIANSVGHNIVRWVIGATTWTIVAGSSSGTSGSTSTLLNQPQDVALDSMGNVYVADGWNNRVQFFLAGQSSGTTIAGTGTPSTTATGLYLPSSVAVDAQFNLYVSDYQNLRVQKFQTS